MTIFSRCILHPGNVAEQVARVDERRDPRDAADDVVGDEAAIAHSGHAGHERRERPDDRHEARDDDREPAVAVVERLRPAQVLLLEPARIGLIEDARPDVVADRVVDRVAEDCRGDQHADQHMDVHAGARDDRPGNEEQRVARQQRENDEAGLGKDDQEQEAIEPLAVLRREVSEGLVERQQ